MFGPGQIRHVLPLIGGVLLLVSAVLGGLYFWSPHATLRITTGLDGVAHRFIAALISVTEAAHPRIKFETVEVPDLQASAQAMEAGKVDIALVRSDLPPPSNGNSLVIIRRDVVAIVVPAQSTIDNIPKLEGKTVAIPTGPVQAENSRLLDLVLGYFNVPVESVKRVFLPMADIAEAVHRKHVAAVLAVGPIGPGQPADVVAALTKTMKGKPQILAIDDAEAFSARYPGFESIDIPEGVFKARPAVPDDSVTTLAITYRFAVPELMLKPVAGALVRSILKTKSRLMASARSASQIEAPDPDEKNPVLPVHPGVADYISNGDQSFLDDLQGLVYLVGIPLSLCASLLALVSSHFSKKRTEKGQQDIFRLLTIAQEAPSADASELADLEREFNAIVADCVSKLVKGGADQAPVSLAIEHARRAIQGRKVALGQKPPVEAPAHDLTSTAG